ncbi:MAG: DUF3891 family protein [Thermoleophilia bacterium]
MIISAQPDGLRLVTQPDHAHQCAALARAWGNDTFRRIDHWDDLVLATEHHDDGWKAWDANPEVDTEGVPIDFPKLDRRVHVDLYSRGVEAVATMSARAGLVVSRHGQGLYEKRMGLDGEPPPREERPEHERDFILGQEALQARLRERLHPAPRPEWEWAAYRLLQTWDVMSLYLTWGLVDRGQPWPLPKVPRSEGDEGVTVTLAATDDGASVDPWPFAESALTVEAPAWTIPNRVYRSPELRTALSSAAPQRLRWVLTPA